MRALRVLLGAGFISRARMTELRDHPAAFSLAAHDVSPVTLAWALYDDLLPRLESGELLIARQELQNADFTRTLLLSFPQIEQGIAALREHQLLAAHGELLRLVFPSRSTLVEALLAKAM